MANSDRPSSTASDKLKLLEALKQLHKEGVVILDDRGGRPRVADFGSISPPGRRNERDSAVGNGEQHLELEDQIGMDPYNKPL
ncbi:MAG: hypothetical protein HKN70_08680 [Gammaproteobacteria bacterium]|nr:hypothetical protein [Gammaproteobacteria bacterium]